jgi:surface antigen
MNRSFLSFSLVAAMLTTSVSFTASADQEDNGAIIGAIIGGILGNQVGKGNGKTVATGLGIILGAVVGADIGKNLDNNDRRALEEAQRDSFRRPIGERTDWDGNSYGSRTGARGNFRTTREGYLRTNSREVCREYESVIVTRQKTETRTGIACSSVNGTWREVNTTEVVFNGSGRVRPIEPSRPMPPRPPVMPIPNYGYGSLRGYCQDYDHSQFMIAKQFAASYNGLYLSQSEATRWAQDYNREHRCGTITEFSSRFQALQSLAASYNGLYLGQAEARSYATEKAEYLSTADVAEMANTISKLRSFVTSYNGLYKGQSDAGRIARNWTDRNNCENSYQIQMMWDQFNKEYQFATSYNGLYLGQTEARNYALGKVSRMSRCSDLLRL